MLLLLILGCRPVDWSAFEGAVARHQEALTLPMNGCWGLRSLDRPLRDCTPGPPQAPGEAILALEGLQRLAPDVPEEERVWVALNAQRVGTLVGVVWGTELLQQTVRGGVTPEAAARAAPFALHSADLVHVMQWEHGALALSSREPSAARSWSRVDHWLLTNQPWVPSLLAEIPWGTSTADQVLAVDLGAIAARVEAAAQALAERAEAPSTGTSAP